MFEPIKNYFLPSNLIAKVAPNIIERNADPQNITMNEPAKGVKENPSRGTKEFKLILPYITKIIKF